MCLSIVAVAIVLQSGLSPQAGIILQADVPLTDTLPAAIACLPIYYDTLRLRDLGAFAHTFPQMLKRSAAVEICLYVAVDDLTMTAPALERLLRPARLRSYTIFESGLTSPPPAVNASATIVEILQRLHQFKSSTSSSSLLVLSPDLLLFGSVARIWQHEACKRVRAGDGPVVAAVQDEDAGVLCISLAAAASAASASAVYATLPGHFNCHGLASAALQRACTEDDGAALRQETARCMGMRWNGGEARPWLDAQVAQECSFHRHYWS